MTLAKKASWKWLLNEDLKQRFPLNVYIDVSDLFFDFAMHKLCRTLENLILHFVDGIIIILFPVLYINMWIYVQINSICSNTI